MITFPEALNALEMVSESLKTAAELETALADAKEDLAGLLSMMEFAHSKKFTDPDEALKYIDDVLVSQLNGIRHSLDSGTQEPIRRLRLSLDQVDRLVLRLRMLAEGNMGNLF